MLCVGLDISQYNSEQTAMERFSTPKFLKIIVKWLTWTIFPKVLQVIKAHPKATFSELLHDLLQARCHCSH